MQIESIEIENYRVFRHARMDRLPRLVALIGANGTGKTTLFDVFTFRPKRVSQSTFQPGATTWRRWRNTSIPITAAGLMRCLKP
ncbi:AAA family ATPase [Allochromatium tepidum]|uniref:AAA family ATPase n=1 Tax=Allochromatium tepidum TaxID=553982 RepID=UPI001BD0B536|nr:AAA family ATPase [Allochromatium tepidum]